MKVGEVEHNKRKKRERANVEIIFRRCRVDEELWASCETVYSEVAGVS